MQGETMQKPISSAKPKLSAAEQTAVDDRPPLGAWRRMYGVVLAVLVVEIILLTVFTRAFS